MHTCTARQDRLKQILLAAEVPRAQEWIELEEAGKSEVRESRPRNWSSERGLRSVGVQTSVNWEGRSGTSRSRFSGPLPVQELFLTVMFQYMPPLDQASQAVPIDSVDHRSKKCLQPSDHFVSSRYPFGCEGTERLQLSFTIALFRTKCTTHQFNVPEIDQVWLEASIQKEAEDYSSVAAGHLGATCLVPSLAKLVLS